MLEVQPATDAEVAMVAMYNVVMGLAVVVVVVVTGAGVVVVVVASRTRFGLLQNRRL